MARADTAPEWCTTIYGVIQHPTEARLLVAPADAGAAPAEALPIVTADRRIWFSEMGAVAQLFRRQLGVDLVVLACLTCVDDEASCQRRALYVLEPRDVCWALPAGARWVGRVELQQLDTAPRALFGCVSAAAASVLHAALDTWLDELEGGSVPAERNPWARPGWFAAAVKWIEAQLAAHGLVVVGPMEQLKSWSISCVLRVPTPAGAHYFKAVPPLFAPDCCWLA